MSATKEKDDEDGRDERAQKEEVERARKAKDDRIRREVWERMNGILPEEDLAGEEDEEGEEGEEEAVEAGDADLVEGAEVNGGVDAEAPPANSI